jgi:hypothetical protein
LKKEISSHENTEIWGDEKLGGREKTVLSKA